MQARDARDENTMTNTFERLIDDRHTAETSLVRRYLEACGAGQDAQTRAVFHGLLARASVQEGVRLFPLLAHRGVEIHLLDESSLMHTRTFKSIDGCVTAAHCKLAGHEQVVLESGGNSGAALVAYCQRVGVETFCFVPQANLALLNGELFAHPASHLIAVSDRNMVKEATHRFAGQRGLPLVPQVAWRFEAAMFRGLFILEQMLAGNCFDWLTQTISAAFGPIGIYRALMRHRQEFDRLPCFLGVQQASNAPMYRAWMASIRGAANIPERTEPLVVSVMYDEKPQTHGTFAELEHLLHNSGGTMTTVNAVELKAFLSRRFDGRTALELLRDNGVSVAVRDGEIVEKAGVLALAGAVKAIDAGVVTAGLRVLCSLTGGANGSDGKAVPEHVIGSLAQVDELPPLKHPGPFAA